MIKTENICFPRSGHRMLLRVLKVYFGDELKNCDVYNDQIMTNRNDFNYQKNHDLDLKTPILNNRNYLVQIRDPMSSIVSHYLLEIKTTGLQDSIEAWKHFAKVKMRYWVNFYKKWILSDIEKRIIIDYDPFLNSPLIHLEKIVVFLGGIWDINKGKESIGKFDLNKKNDYKKFKYYDEVFFRTLEDKIKYVVKDDML